MDESQQRGHYFVGAAVAPPEDWTLIASRLAELRASIADAYGTPPDAEFHGHPLMNGKDDWEKLKGRHRETINTYLRALTVLDGTSVSFVICGVDIQRLNARYRYPWPPHSVCMGHVLERINDGVCKHSGAGSVRVIADQTSEEKSLQDRLKVSHAIGTQGYRSSHLERIREPMEFAESAETDGLQVVDLALYLKQRAFHVPVEGHKKAEAGRRKLLDKLQPHVRSFRVWQP